jgi:N-formylglutamate amidohydrolase
MTQPKAADELYWGPSPLVIHVPHSSTAIPDEVRADLLLDDAELDLELKKMTDWDTLDIAHMALDRSGLRAQVMENPYSRLVYFHPYAQMISALVDRVLDECGNVVIVDLHSFPSRPLAYELDQTALRPGICIGTDPFHTPDVLVAMAEESFADVPGGFALNTPFSGTYVPLEHYGRTSQVWSIMIEIRRDLYQAEPGGPRHDGLRDVITGLVRLLTRAVWIGA